MSAPAAPATSKDTREKTGYVVLAKNEKIVDVTKFDGTQWIVIADVWATNANAAIRELASGDGTYIAIPARSWKPVTVKTETKTVLTLT